jgi:hypothetical protein
MVIPQEISIIIDDHNSCVAIQSGSQQKITVMASVITLQIAGAKENME